MKCESKRTVFLIILIVISVFVTPVSLILTLYGMAVPIIRILLPFATIMLPTILMYIILLKLKKRNLFIIFHYIYAVVLFIFGAYMFRLSALAAKAAGCPFGGLGEGMLGMFSYAVSIINAVSLTIALIIYYFKQRKRKKQMEK